MQYMDWWQHIGVLNHIPWGKWLFLHDIMSLMYHLSVTTNLWLCLCCVFVPHVCAMKMWITQREYDECGPSIVHRKCF